MNIVRCMRMTVKAVRIEWIRMIVGIGTDLIEVERIKKSLL